MKKLISVISIVMCVIFLSSCAVKLPEGMSEDTVIESAANLVTILNNKDYTAFDALCEAPLAEAFASSPISDVWEPLYSDAGTFDKIEKTTLQASNGYAVATVQAKYSNKNIVFTFSFSPEYKLGGIYLK